MKKNILILGGIAAFACIIMTGCGNKNTETETETTAVSEETEAETTAETVIETEEETGEVLMSETETEA